MLDGQDMGYAGFDSEVAANDARILIERVRPAACVRVDVEWVRLGHWRADDAEQMLLRAAWRADLRVSAIKFARAKSGAGLKEAKDWCDEHLPS